MAETKSDAKRYAGVVPPMLTPFTPGGAIDEPAVGRIVERLLSGGVSGIFPLGTTGESASIANADKRKLVAATVKAVNGRAMNYAGISGNCFSESVELAKAFADDGVDAVVAHCPSYFGLTDADLDAYFHRLADALPLPLVLYNIPVTTHHNLPLDVVGKLIRHEKVVAIKDSSGDRDHLRALLELTGGRGGFPVLLGNSSCYASALRHGAVGLVPGGAHLVAKEYVAMLDAAMRQDWPEVDRLQAVTDAATSAFTQGRTIGEGLARLKALLEKQGICGRTMLPPLRDNTEPA